MLRNSVVLRNIASRQKWSKQVDGHNFGSINSIVILIEMPISSGARLNEHQRNEHQLNSHRAIKHAHGASDLGTKMCLSSCTWHFSPRVSIYEIVPEN